MWSVIPIALVINAIISMWAVIHGDWSQAAFFLLLVLVINGRKSE